MVQQFAEIRVKGFADAQRLLYWSGIGLLILLLVMLWSITHHGVFTVFNNEVYYYLQSLRTPFWDKIMTVFTLLGDRKCILGFATLMLIYLVLQRYWRASVHWLALMILVIGSALAIKHGYYSPRPAPDLPTNSLSSLPSGHAVFTMAFFGFLAVLIGQELTSGKRRLCYVIAGSLIFLAGFSRIYLGPHWLTDVLSSYVLGLVCVLFVTISYRRQLRSHIAPKKLGWAALIILAIIWSGYSALRYSTTLEFHEQHLVAMRSTSL